MSDKQTPPDWVIREAEKRAGINLPLSAVTYNNGWVNGRLRNGGAFRALCDMIERYEQPPVDRKLLCAREAVARLFAGEFVEAEIRAGQRDECDHVVCATRAIELFEEGFGK